MKTLLSIIFACLLFKGSSAQKTDSLPVRAITVDEQLQVNELLVKANRYKTWGWSLLAGSIALLGFSLLLNDDAEYIPDPSQPVEESKGMQKQGKVACAGFVIMGASIPCFIKSHKILKQAEMLVFTEKQVSLSPQLVLPKSASAGVRLVIPLGK